MKITEEESKQISLQCLEGVQQEIERAALNPDYNPFSEIE